jgi:D-alanyl-D-alanine carboxypeptidase
MREGLELNEKVKVQGKSGGRFPRGTMVSRNDLLKAMLISSDNLAAETLAHTFPGGMDAFLKETNRWVKGLGMIHTEIVDASGLLPGNVSNVDDLVFMLNKIKEIDVIRKIASERQEVISLPRGKKKHTIRINLHNTNPTLFHFDNILISKTGFTNPAGRCVVMLVNKGERLYAVIVLGQRNIKERSQIAEDLINKKPMPAPKVSDPISFDFEINYGTN